jgi:hypothetical protein
MDSTIIAALIGASSSIIVALIMISHSRAREPGDRHGNGSQKPDPEESRPGRRAEPVPPVTLMPRFTVHGEVIRTVGKDLGIRVENEADLRAFWRDHRIDTDLDWFGKGPPVVSIGRKADMARCKPGDRVSLTFIVEDRAGGKRGTRTVDFGVHSVGA